MAKATEKSPEIESFLADVLGKSRVVRIEQNLCVRCDKEVGQFRDPLSSKEYTISGLCQACQDNMFGV